MTAAALNLLGEPLPCDPFDLPCDDPALFWAVDLAGLVDGSPWWADAPDLRRIEAGEYGPQALTGWANYLAGGPTWLGCKGNGQGRDGMEFRGHVWAWRYARVRWGSEGPVLPDCPPNCVLHALADDLGGGWFPHDVLVDSATARRRLQARPRDWVVFGEVIRHRVVVRYSLGLQGAVCRIVAVDASAPFADGVSAGALVDGRAKTFAPGVDGGAA